MSVIREVIETAHTWPADERDFYIRRAEAKERSQYPRCWGISSDALTHYALGVAGWPHKGHYPADNGDLAACELTYEMAPERLKKIMLPVLEAYRERVLERYPR